MLVIGECLFLNVLIFKRNCEDPLYSEILLALKGIKNSYMY